MLTDAAFLVVDVPAEGTVLGGLTHEVPGLEVDLVGRPDTSGPTHCYVLDYIIGPISVQQREEVAARLEPLYEEFVAKDAGQGRWHVRGRVALEKIHVPALRLVAGLYGLTQAPWLVLREGRARATLRPRDEASAEMLAALVRARMAQLRVDGNVWLEYLDLAPYEERRSRLAQPIAPAASGPA